MTDAEYLDIWAKEYGANTVIKSLGLVSNGKALSAERLTYLGNMLHRKGLPYILRALAKATTIEQGRGK